MLFTKKVRLFLQSDRLLAVRGRNYTVERVHEDITRYITNVYEHLVGKCHKMQQTADLVGVHRSDESRLERVRN
jgi:hypothetical protein